MGEPLFPEAFLRKIERLTLVARREEGTGTPRADRRGGRTEFVDHRRYSTGDDLRYVDWHLYGRTGRLFLKEFAREETADVVLVLDTSGSMTRKIRGALRLSAALLVVALARGDRVRVAAARSGELTLTPPIQGGGRRRELLDRLVAVEADTGGETDLDASLRRLPPGRGTGRRLTLLVSDLLTEKDGRRELAAQPGDSAVFQWLLPDERRPPPTGRSRLVSAEGGELTVFVGPEACEAYERAMRARMEELAAWYARRGVRYLLAPAERPVEELVFEVLVGEGLLQ